MNNLIPLVEELKNSQIKNLVKQRMYEFSSIPRDFDSLFSELAFCILAAGTSAELGIKTIKHLGETLHKGSEKQIQKKLKEVYRFHTIRAGYLHKARSDFKNLDINASDIREKLVESIKGIGFKEASHFLRNIGYKDYAIVDFHIVDILANHGVIERPKTMTPKRYLEIEEVLKILAKKLKMNLGELDLYLWYKETGKILK